MEPAARPAYGRTGHVDKEEPMRAMVQDTYGPADAAGLRDIGRPEAGEEQVLVRVRAAGVDRGVWHLMTGLPYPVRLAGYGIRAPKTPIPGMDLAGVVEAAGKNVTRFQPGDEVFGIGQGTFAEYACAHQGKLAPKPANLTFEQAAVIAISGLAALQGLRDRGRAAPGQQVLIIGASGGVGTFAVQLAKAFGAEVTGVCSGTKADLVRSLGAGHVIDYTRDDFAKAGQRYDLILDIGGNSPLSRLRRALTPAGTLLSSAARRAGGGLAAPTASSGRCFCLCSWARSSPRSSPRKSTRTWSCSRTSSKPGSSHRSSTGPTRSARPPRPSGTCRKDTPAGRSPSSCDAGHRSRTLLDFIGQYLEPASR
jgi:NADPH:quinone reductase-like Zn-dependent oxidoreductase